MKKVTQKTKLKNNDNSEKSKIIIKKKKSVNFTVDSGSGISLTNRKWLIHDYEPLKVPPNYSGVGKDGSLNIVGKGKMKMIVDETGNNVDIPTFYCTDKHTNILSISDIINTAKFKFSNDLQKISNGNISFNIECKDDVFFIRAEKIFIPKMIADETPKNVKEQTNEKKIKKMCHSGSKKLSAYDFHSKLSHLPINTINQGIRFGVYDDVKSVPITDTNFSCNTCELAKAKRHAHHKDSMNAYYSAAEPGSAWSMDLRGPIGKNRRNTDNYMLLMVDNVSRYMMVSTHPNKDEKNIKQQIENNINIIEKQFNRKVQQIISDHGSEFNNATLKSYFDAKGIVHILADVGDHASNARAERYIGVMNSDLRVLMSSRVPWNLWPYAIQSAARARNCSYKKAIKTSPIKLLSSNKAIVKLKSFIPFGASAIIWNHNAHKTENGGLNAIALSKDQNGFGYYFYIPDQRKVISTNNYTLTNTPISHTQDENYAVFNLDTTISDSTEPNIITEVPLEDTYNIEIDNSEHESSTDEISHFNLLKPNKLYDVPTSTEFVIPPQLRENLIGSKHNIDIGNSKYVSENTRSKKRKTMEPDTIDTNNISDAAFTEYFSEISENEFNDPEFSDDNASDTEEKQHENNEILIKPSHKNIEINPDETFIETNAANIDTLDEINEIDKGSYNYSNSDPAPSDYDNESETDNNSNVEIFNTDQDVTHDVPTLSQTEPEHTEIPELDDQYDTDDFFDAFSSDQDNITSKNDKLIENKINNHDKDKSSQNIDLTTATENTVSVPIVTGQKRKYDEFLDKSFTSLTRPSDRSIKKHKKLKIVFPASDTDTLPPYNHIVRSIYLNKAITNNKNLTEKTLFQEALNTELHNLVEMKVFDPNIILDTSDIDSTKLVKTQPIFTKKRDGKHKARIVCRGDLQSDTTFSDIATDILQIDNLKMFLMIINDNSMMVQTLDINHAFLYADLREELYIPHPFQKDKITPLRKALYGLKQSSKEWNDHFRNFLNELDLFETEYTPGIFTNNDSSLMLAVYVDDCIIAAKSETQLSEFIKKLKDKFKLKIVGTMENEILETDILGMDLHYDRNKGQVNLSLKSYISSIEDVFANGTKKIKQATLPYVTDYNIDTDEVNQLSMNEKKKKKKELQQIIGIVNYIRSRCRSDIEFATNKLARLVEFPTAKVFYMGYKILKYLFLTKDLALTFYRNQDFSKKITVMTDASLGNEYDLKSRMGVIIWYGDNLYKIISKATRTIRTSSTAAELDAMVLGDKEAALLSKTLETLNIPHDETIKLITDSKPGIQFLRKDFKTKRRDKFLDIYDAHLKERIKNGKVQIFKIDGEQNIADVLTKTVTKTSTDRLNQLIENRIHPSSLHFEVLEKINENVFSKNKSN